MCSLVLYHSIHWCHGKQKENISDPRREDVSLAEQQELCSPTAIFCLYTPLHYQEQTASFRLLHLHCTVQITQLGNEHLEVNIQFSRKILSRAVPVYSPECVSPRNLLPRTNTSLSMLLQLYNCLVVLPTAAQDQFHLNLQKLASWRQPP